MSDLFTARQTSAVHVFNLSLGDEDTDAAVVDSLLRDARAFYDSLGHHYRVVARPAGALRPAQSYGVAVEMFSPHRNAYVEVGSLAAYGDYLGRRMMLKAVAEEGQQPTGALADLRVVSGTVADVTRLVGCLVEASQDEEGDYVL